MTTRKPKASQVALVASVALGAGVLAAVGADGDDQVGMPATDGPTPAISTSPTVGGPTPVISTSPTVGEFLTDVQAGNIEHVIVNVKDKSLLVRRRNSEQYEIARFVNWGMYPTELVRPLRARGVEVLVVGENGERTTTGGGGFWGPGLP
jgi:hypothetical protein